MVLCLRRRRWKLAYRWCCLLVVAFISVFVWYWIQQEMCSLAESRQIIEQLCQDFRSGRALGNLCDSMCRTHGIQLLRCTNYRQGKLTIVASWDGENIHSLPIVLKSKKSRLSDYDSLRFMKEGSSDLPDGELFVSMVADSVKFTMRGAPSGKNNHTFPHTDTQVISKMWSLSWDSLPGRPEVLRPAMHSVWALLQQDEYVLNKYAESSKYMPQIYGTCGHVYGVEYLPPGDILSPSLSQVIRFAHPGTWRQRVRLAILILDLLKSFNQDFPQTLHICDMKGANFGLTLDNGVKVIDLDMVMFNSRLEETFSHTNCTEDKDCDFFDCAGSCDTDIGQCLPHRINNNLQAACTKVFLPSLSNAYNGLLPNPLENVRDELMSLLEDCSKMKARTVNPISYKNKDFNMIASVEAEIMKRLHNLLSTHLYSDLLKKEEKS